MTPLSAPSYPIWLVSASVVSIFAFFMVQWRPPQPDPRLHIGWRRASARIVVRLEYLVFFWPWLQDAFFLVLALFHFGGYFHAIAAAREAMAAKPLARAAMADIVFTTTVCWVVDVGVLVAWVWMKYVRARGWRVINKFDLAFLPIEAALYVASGWLFAGEAGECNPAVEDLEDAARDALASCLARNPSKTLTVGALKMCLDRALAPRPVRLYSCFVTARSGSGVWKTCKNLGHEWAGAKKLWRAAVMPASDARWEEGLGVRADGAGRLPAARAQWAGVVLEKSLHRLLLPAPARARSRL